METTTLSSKGQIIIPKAIRETHHWGPGEKFIIEETQTGILLKPARLFPVTTLEEGFGCAGYRGPGKSLEEMTKGVEEGLRKAWKRSGR